MNYPNANWISRVGPGARVSEHEIILAELKAKAHKLSLELIEERKANEFLRDLINVLVTE